MHYLKRQRANTINVFVIIMLAQSSPAFGAIEDGVKEKPSTSPSSQHSLGSKVNNPEKSSSDTVEQRKEIPETGGYVTGKQRIPRPALQLAPNRPTQAAPHIQGNSSPPNPLPDRHEPQVAPNPKGVKLDSQTPTKSEAQSGTLLKDNYPAVGQMEITTFSYASPELPVEDRLSRIEQTVYKRNYSQDSLFDRTERLKRTLFGEPSHVTESGGDQSSVNLSPDGGPSDSGYGSYFEEIARRPINQRPVPKEDVEKFVLELINNERANLGHAPLLLDEFADKVAKEHVSDLSKRNLVSHTNAKGLNPDERYTLSGGTNALTESLVSVKCEDPLSEKFTRALAARILKILFTRQDDRDAILNSEATNFGMAVDQTVNKDKFIACLEIITKRGSMHPIPPEVQVGDKIEISGVIEKPYKFERVTIAWEGLNTNLSSTPDESDESLPYFPPLDYVAYATKSEHDYGKTMGALRTVGVIAAIAGGMFMPPVALAVPLIAMSGGVVEPKPASDIPVRGRIKVEGSSFHGKVPISNNGKEGLYYVTVWTSLGDSMKLVPISRRTIIGKLDVVAATSQVQSESDRVTNKDGAKQHRSKKKRQSKDKHNSSNDQIEKSDTRSIAH